MDFSSVYTEVFKTVWWLYATALLVGLLEAPWFKGTVGEAWGTFAAWVRLPADNYHRIHNVTLPTPDGTMQVDHVVVSGKCALTPVLGILLQYIIGDNPRKWGILK